MIAFALIPAALGRFGRSISPRGWWALLLTAGLLVLLAYCTNQVRQEERARYQREHAEAYARALEREAKADEKAATRRVEDITTTIDREKERQDATAQLPDTRPSDRRIARACVQLRQQGTADRDLPAACR